MTDLNEILGAFEQALELERELGTRTVDCDRTLLVPLQAVPPSPPVAPAPPTVAPVVPRGRDIPVASPAPAAPPRAVLPAPVASPRTALSAPAITAPAPVAAPAPSGALVDFAFIAEAIPQGAAGELLEKMVAAMGYTLAQVTVVAAASAASAPPRAKVYVVLGSDAFKQFAPGQRASLGLWTSVAEVPTVVTYSPARILSYWSGDAAALTKAKRQIWSDLKSALARIGREPPARH